MIQSSGESLHKKYAPLAQMLENLATISPLLFSLRETGHPVSVLSLTFLRRRSCGLEKGKVKAETPPCLPSQALF